ncbi:lipopolysaccharide assembly protein LapB [Aliikangiella marina]|uniref:Lipopolysaccharide assembly protein B n=1 Tax=Aliikangiella marina TaxID=1712262 RepID=A0A545TI34_9GAMM|nr:lipopolysaccharide assembly protein LapB [Aliikangiella marina]TQV76887.1 lipopolysaccharide assembly protein LapB [Aliikangiella marina]
MYELLTIFAFLLPLAWYFGYRKGSQRSNSNAASSHVGLSKKYFTGINYLLNEEDDKAIDTFVGLLEDDPEAVELFMAVSKLYRRRGEVDRAIGCHQNIIARTSLSTVYRKMALLELGYDYMAAGLLDRAENIFKELVNDQNHKQASLKQLLLIYQQTKDWEKAIKVSEKLQVNASSSLKTEIAHFYCELAENKLYMQLPKDALGFVKKALQVDPNCSRATLINGDIEYALGRYKQAIKAYRGLIKQDVEILPEAINKITSSFLQLNDRKGLIQFLEQAISQGGGVSIILTYAEEIKKQHGDRAAGEYIAEQLAVHPSIKGLLKLIELHIKHANETARPSLLMLQEVVSKLLKNKPVYHCNLCGFDSKTLFWQCPSCKNWGSVKPIQGIEGE